MSNETSPSTTTDLSSEDRSSLPTAIRCLMELHDRREDYREALGLISLVAGGLASCVGGVLVFLDYRDDTLVGRSGFVAIWSMVLAAVLLFSAVVFSNRAIKRGDRILSLRTWIGLAAVGGPLGMGGIGLFTEWGSLGGIDFPGDLPFLPWHFASFGKLGASWAFFYGFALMGTFWFAPRSVSYLGMAFVLTSMGFALAKDEITDWIDTTIPFVQLSRQNYELVGEDDLCMFLTFGGYHLIFALMTPWRVPWKKA